MQGGFSYVYLVEDTGGQGVSTDQNDINGPNKVAKQPNSYVYRFVPEQTGSLDAGRLEALQVSVDGAPLVFYRGRYGALSG